MVNIGMVGDSGFYRKQIGKKAESITATATNFALSLI
jgi:hypothetical protein